jgi:23S rRNA pseudouridine1911/1915/1917 synthase
LTEQSFHFVFQDPEGKRLDHFLADVLPHYSRSRLQSLIKAGWVQVDGSRASKASQSLRIGSAVHVHVPASEPAEVMAESLPLDVVFENDDIMVVNKVAGMVVHPAAGHSSGTLVNAALGRDPHMEGVGGEIRPGVVHRLDKATSGIILLAKNDATLRWLQGQFASRQVEKHYLALVDGRPPTLAGRVETAIGRDSNHRKRMAVVSEGKGRLAITEYRTLEVFPRHTHLEIHPLTGRTHQIRLHCAFLGSPIVGDTIYGHRTPSVNLGRHFLHAARLAVILPGETQPREFIADLPGELQGVLEALRGEATRRD